MEQHVLSSYEIGLATYITFHYFSMSCATFVRWHKQLNHLNLTIAEVARQNGQQVLNFRTDLREALPDYQCLPKTVVDIAHVTNVITGTGIEIKLNLPNIPIPEGDGEFSGTFGACNAQSHNVYEAYISPYITAARE